MGENRMYFTVGFKSYDITRLKSRSELWYDWVERSRNLMRRTTFNKKTMEWICFVLQEASRDTEAQTRRWKMKEQYALFFCSRKYNKFGRYISIVSVQGDNRSVIIIPEGTLNVGWRDIAFKISRFIKEDTSPINVDFFRKTDPKIPYVAAVKSSKWQSKGANDALINTSDNKITITEGKATTERGILGRCVVGQFNIDLKEKPTLSDIRRWAVSTWKNTFGVNIYEMADNQFLFEFPTKYMAGQVLQGEWNWKSQKIVLEWWTPVVGCCTNIRKREWTWVRAMGLPLHLWSDKIFKAIGEQCGGWLETEEETSLKNHLKWARLKVKGDGSNIPKEVKIEDKGLIFIIPIWSEVPTLVVAGDEKSKSSAKDQRLIEIRKVFSRLDSCLKEREDHVGQVEFHTQRKNLAVKGAYAREGEKTSLNIGGPSEERLAEKNTGPVLFSEAQFITQHIWSPNMQNWQDLVQDEIAANNAVVQKEDCSYLKLDKLVLLHTEEEEEELPFQDSKETEGMEESDDQGDNYVDAMMIIEGDEVKLMKTGGERDMHSLIINESGTDCVEGIEPLNSMEIQEENDEDMDTTLWVHQKIIKLSKQFGICFKGCEKEAKVLFKKIDSGRQAIRQEIIKQEAEKAQPSEGIFFKGWLPLSVVPG